MGPDTTHNLAFNAVKRIQVCKLHQNVQYKTIQYSKAFIPRAWSAGGPNLRFDTRQRTQFKRRNWPEIQIRIIQEAQLSPSDRVMRLVSSNLANYHATVQKLLIRQVLTKLMVWSWRISWRQWPAMCHKQTDDGRIVYITCIPTTCCGEIF